MHLLKFWIAFLSLNHCVPKSGVGIWLFGRHIYTKYCVIYSVQVTEVTEVLLRYDYGLRQSQWTPAVTIHWISLLFFIFLSPLLFVYLFPLTSPPTLWFLYLSHSLFCIFFYSFYLVLTDHHWHKSNASIHVQPSPRAYRPGRETGRLLPGEGCVWGRETWRTQAQGQKPPYLTALTDKIHRRRHGWLTHGWCLLKNVCNQTNICTKMKSH